MNRPFSDKRIIGPFSQIDILDAEPTGVEIREGPIWTWIEVTTYKGRRKNSSTVTREHVSYVESEVKRILVSKDVKDRLDFAGELTENDIFCDSYTDLTISCFIRHPEDFMSIRLLDEVIDVLQPAINQHEDLTMRDYRVVTEKFVQDKDPVIV